MSLFSENQGAAQGGLFDGIEHGSPAEAYAGEADRRALDELFHAAQQYQTGKAYGELLAFIKRFRFYSPFNAMLLHIQNPGTTYAAPAARWRKQYDRAIVAGARPLVILQPMGPVMFVFDVSETEPASDKSPPLPDSIGKPFEPTGEVDRKRYIRLCQNAVRDGVNVVETPQGSERAGHIQVTEVTGGRLQFSEKIDVPRRYELVLNAAHSVPARFTTLVHELGHLYCGHLGVPFRDCKWWPDRRGLAIPVQEFEAESIAHLVCSRMGLQTTSDDYLSRYLDENGGVPRISLDRVLVAAGLIESMCARLMPPNRSPKREVPKGGTLAGA